MIDRFEDEARPSGQCVPSSRTVAAAPGSSGSRFEYSRSTSATYLGGDRTDVAMHTELVTQVGSPLGRLMPIIARVASACQLPPWRATTCRRAASHTRLGVDEHAVEVEDHGLGHVASRRHGDDHTTRAKRLDGGRRAPGLRCS